MLEGTESQRGFESLLGGLKNVKSLGLINKKVDSPVTHCGIFEQNTPLAGGHQRQDSPLKINRREVSKFFSQMPGDLLNISHHGVRIRKNGRIQMLKNITTGNPVLLSGD